MTEAIKTNAVILGIYKNNENYEFTNTASKYLGDLIKVGDLIKKYIFYCYLKYLEANMNLIQETQDVFLMQLMFFNLFIINKTLEN